MDKVKLVLSVLSPGIIYTRDPFRTSHLKMIRLGDKMDLRKALDIGYNPG